MRLRLAMILLGLLVAVMVLASSAAAQKLLCVSSQELRGQETVASCLAKGERFAVIDEYGLVKILSPEEVELTQAFNPKVFETRAFGVKYQKEAPKLPPLPVSTEQPG